MSDVHSESLGEAGKLYGHTQRCHGRKGDGMGGDVRGDRVARVRDCGMEGEGNDVEGTAMSRDRVGYNYFAQDIFESIEVRDYWTGELLLRTTDFYHFANPLGFREVREWKESWVVDRGRMYPLWTEKGRD